MEELTNFSLNDDHEEFIYITTDGVIWTNKTSFNKTSLKLTINYLLDNCYFT